MNFDTKSYLKSTRNHTAKHALKVLLTLKCIKIIFFYFKKIIFDIITSKQYKNINKKLF
jgi:preprotein translocase subunit SecB